MLISFVWFILSLCAIIQQISCKNNKYDLEKEVGGREADIYLSPALPFLNYG